MKPVLIHLRPLDVPSDTRVDVRLGDGPGAETFGAGGLEWQPALSKRPQLSIELFSPDMTGQVQAGKARFEINLRLLRDVLPANLFWRGASCTIWTDDALEGPAATPAFTGHVTEATPDDQSSHLTFSAEVSTALIDKPLLTREFDGDGAAGGDPDKRGVLKPAGFGSVRNIEPVWFDLTRNIGMIDGYSNTIAIAWLGEGRSSFGPSVGDYADYEALAAAADEGEIPPGRWATCIAEGLVALGAPPAGVITCDALFGSNRAGLMMRRMLEVHADVDETDIDTASFAALDTAVARGTHYWTAEQRNVKDLLEAIARSCNAAPLLSFQGKVAVTRVTASAPVLTLDRSGGTDPRVLGWRQGQQEPPYYRLQARTARPARVLSFDEVNFVDELEDRGLYDAAETYRAGHVVWLKNGSQWLYVADVPAADHAPPAPPATSNDWWQQLQPPTYASDISYDDGTPIEALKPAEPGATNSADPDSPFGPDGTVADALASLAQAHADTDALAVLVLGELDDVSAALTFEAARLDGRIDDADAAIALVAGDLAAAEAAIDVRLDDAETAIDTVAGDLAGATATLTGRADAADAALATARARIAQESERLQAAVGLTRVGVLAEANVRISALAIEVSRIDGIIAELDDPADGLPAAHALIAALESVTVDLENPSSLASQLAVLEAAIDDVDGALDARVSTLETASAQQAADLSDLAGDVAILDAGLIAAQGDIADNDTALVALAGRTDTIEAELDAQGDAIADTEASLLTVSQAVALEAAAGTYRGELASVRVGMAQVSVLAETLVRATAESAIYSAINVVDLKLETPVTGVNARLGSLETAVVDLDATKAEVSTVDTLSATVSGHSSAIGALEGEADALDGRLDTAEAEITSQSSAIAALDLDLGDLEGSLALVAGDLAALDGRVGDVEGAAASLATTVSGLSATVTSQGEAIGDAEDALGDAQADIVAIQAVAATDRAALAWESELVAVRSGLAMVSALAERTLSATDTAALYDAIDVVDLKLETPVTGVNARLGSLETAVVDLDATKAEASTVDTLSATVSGHSSAIGALEGEADALDGRLDTAEAAITSQSSAVAALDLDLGAVEGSLAVVAGDLATLDGRVDDAEGRLDDAEGAAVSLAATVSGLSATVASQGTAIGDAEDAISDAQADIVSIEAVGATQGAAIAYRAERLSAQAGLAVVSVLAERSVSATAESAIYSSIAAVDLKIEAPTIGVNARLGSLETAVVDLEATKAEVSTVDTLSATVSGHSSAIGALEGEADALDGRVTTAEGTITTHSSAIAALDLDLGDLEGSLALVAGDLAALDGRVGDVEGVAGTLVTTVAGLSASVDSHDGRLDDAEASLVTMQAVAATDRAALAREAEFASVRVGLSQVAVAAERTLSATETTAIYNAINVVDLKLTTPVTGLQARMTTAETAIVDLDAGKAEASVVTTLSARVDDAEAAITDVTAVAASADGIAKATKGLLLDVNGKISGWVSENDGSTSSFAVLADNFSVTGGTGARTEFSDGNWRIYYASGDLCMQWGIVDE